MLNLIEQQIAPFDPQRRPRNPSLEPNMGWTQGLDAPFVIYSPLNYTVTLKMGLGSLKVVESGTIRYSTYHFIFVFYGKYASICYRFRGIAAYWSTKWPSAIILDLTFESCTIRSANLENPTLEPNIMSACCIQPELC